MLTSVSHSQTRAYRVSCNPRAQKGVLRGSHGGDKVYVNALAPGADVRVWLLQDHADHHLKHGLKFVLCSECSQYAFLKQVDKNSDHHCPTTKNTTNVMRALRDEDSLFTYSNVLWPHDVDEVEASVANVTLQQAYSQDLLSATTASSASAQNILQQLLPTAINSSLADCHRVYWVEQPTDKTLAAALDHVAHLACEHPESTHVFGSTLPTTIFSDHTAVGVVQWMAKQWTSGPYDKPKWLHCGSCGGNGLGKQDAS